MMPPRPYYLLIALWALLALPGCALWRDSKPAPRAPDYVRVSRFAPSDLVRRGGNWTQVLGRDFQAEASARLSRPTTSTTSTQVTSLTSSSLVRSASRAAARRTALRALAREIINTTDSAGVTLREALAPNPGALTALDAVLNSRAQLHLADLDQATSAQATLSGTIVAESLRVSELVPAPSPAELSAARDRATERALEAAKAGLKTALLETTISQGVTFAARYAAREQAINELDALIFVLQPDAIASAPDGSTRVELYFDRNAVRDIARRQRGHGLTNLFGLLNR